MIFHSFVKLPEGIETGSQDILRAALPDDVAHFREWWLTIQPKLAPEGGQNSHLQIVALLG